MKSLKDLTIQAIDRKNVHRTAKAQRALKMWPEIVGPILAQRCFPERYEKGTVWVAVTGAAWAQELRMSRFAILERLQEASGDPGLFQEMRFGVRQLPEGKSEEAEAEAAQAWRASLKDLSIREIAEQRLSRWSDDEPV